MLIISNSTHLYIFILLPRRRKKIIQNIYRYIVKNIKKRRLLLFCIVREENIRPKVLKDKISPPFFQHYGKKISYRILSYYLQLKHWLSSSQNDPKKIHHRFSFTLHLCDSGSVYKDFERFFVSLILQNI